MKILLACNISIIFFLASDFFCNRLLSFAAHDKFVNGTETINITFDIPEKNEILEISPPMLQGGEPLPISNKEDGSADEIHSSFEDGDKTQASEDVNTMSLMTLSMHNHLNIATEITESGQEAVVYTLLGSELPQHDSVVNTSEAITLPPTLGDGLPLNDSEHIVEAELPPTYQEVDEVVGATGQVAEEEREIKDTLNTSQTTEQPPPTPQEDIPSFSEWTQKQLKEAEKRKGDNMTGGGAVTLKTRHIKNYASTDCGAKVVGYNPEANSASSVLSPSRDEYLLNTCNSKIWFIVELCEAIQPKKIEIANFELFSSSPHEFSVWLSDRYPSRDWVLAGRLSAQDERTVQAYNLSHTTHFGKYVKVEVHSHHGREHYCPISLFRVYGTSEIEVLNTVDEEEVHSSGVEDDDDDLLMGEGGDAPKNLFGSARDALLTIVKKAAGALVKTPDEEGRVSSNYSETDHITSINELVCATPSHLVVCVNCSDDYYDKVYQLMSCRRQYLEHLLHSGFVKKTMAASDYCAEKGLDLRVGAPYPTKPQPAGQPQPIQYLQALFLDQTLAALCNVLAVEHRKVVLNISLNCNETTPVFEEPTPQLPEPAIVIPVVDANISEETVATRPPSATSLDEPPAIRPSRTLAVEDMVPMEGELAADNVAEESPTVVTPTVVTPTVVTEPTEDTAPDNNTSVGGDVEDSVSLDSLFSELEQAVVPRVPPTVHKESVFVRLANRIKALERNMSLSSQYLEELSRRYKKQVEEMQKALAGAGEERRRGDEREARRLETLSQLSHQVNTLTTALKELLTERDSWQHKTTVMAQHGVIVIVEVVVFAAMLYVCRWLPEVGVSRRKFSMAWPRAGNGFARRKSVDEVFEPAQAKKRRPSEEALISAGNTHQDLLIPEERRKISKGETRRQRRKRNRDLAMQSEDRNHNNPFLLDSNSTESVAGWWENDLPTPEASDPSPPRHVVVATVPRSVQTAVAQRLDRIAYQVSDKKDKTTLPVKKTGPFKKIVKKFF